MPMFYNFVLHLALAAAAPVLLPLILLIPRRRRTVLQRLGLADRPPRMPVRADAHQRPVWVHALSVGEVISAVPLVRQLARELKGRKIVFSVSTLTGFQIAQQQLPAAVSALFFFPYDLPFSIRRTVDRVRPGIVVIVESDLWPNFLTYLTDHGVPVVLVNARLSEKSLRGYGRFPLFTRRVLGRLAAVCTQSRRDAARFRALGVPWQRLAVTGNLKFDQPAPALSAEQAAGWRRRLFLPQGVPTIVAGSTHPGEEELLLAAFSKLKADLPEARLIVAPRKPERAAEVVRLFQTAGLRAHALGDLAGQNHSAPWAVAVVDTLGLLRTLYALADISVIGGSFTPLGGHNPLEPAACAKPVIFGRDMSNFSEVSRLLLAAGGAAQVLDAPGLYRQAADLLKDPLRARKMGQQAAAVFNANKGAVKRTVAVLKRHWNTSCGRGRMRRVAGR
jgi:3-deoxy-D-manno-octulosonic-acid transferase